MMGRIRSVVARGKAAAAAMRERYAWVDHLVRAKKHYDEVRGDRLAASVTYFGFLSLFPLLILAYAVLGYLVEFFPDIRANVTEFLSEQFPGIDVQQIAGARTTAGVIGLVGLLLAGLGWVSALREALRAVWCLGPPTRNFIVQKALDALVLAMLGVAVLASLGISNVATNATHQVLELVGLDGSGIARFVLPVLTVILSIGVDVVVIVVAFTRLPGVTIPPPYLFRGALLGAVGLEVLKLAGSFLVGHTTKNPAYATVAIAVGLLIWLDLISRLLLFTACWTYTGYAGPSPPADLPEKVPVPVLVPAPRRPRSRLVLAALAMAGLVGFRLGRARAAAARSRRPGRGRDPG
jgi:membrane protein